MMNSVLGGRGTNKNRQMPDVIAETPDSSSSRSRRTSTLNSSAATRSFLMQSSKCDQTPWSRGPKVEQTRIEQTPDNTVQLGQKTIIAETPDDTVVDTTKESDVEGRAATLGIFSDSPTLIPSTKNKSTMKVKHGPKMRQLPLLLPSEESFILSSQQQVNSTFVSGPRQLDVEPTSHLPTARSSQEHDGRSPIISSVSSSSRRKKGRPVKIMREVSPSKEKNDLEGSPSKEKNDEVEKHKNRLKSVEVSMASPSKEKANSDVEKHKNRLKTAESTMASPSNEKNNLDVDVEKHKIRLKTAESTMACSSKEKNELDIEKHKNRLKLAETNMTSRSPSNEKNKLDVEKHKNRLKLAESSIVSSGTEKNELEIEKHKNRLRLAESSRASPSREKTELDVEKHKNRLKLAELSRAFPIKERNDLDVEKHRNRLKAAESSRISFGLGEKCPKNTFVLSENDNSKVTLELSEKNTSTVSLGLLQEDPFRTDKDICEDNFDLSGICRLSPENEKSLINIGDTGSRRSHQVQSHVKYKLAPVFESDDDSCEKDSLDMSGIGRLSPDKPNGKILGANHDKVVTKSVITPKSKKDNDRRSRRSNVNREDFLSFLFQKEKSPDRNAQPKKLDNPVSDDIYGNNFSDSDSDDGWESMMGSDGSIKKYLPTFDPNRKSVVISGNIKSRTKQNLERASGNVLPSKSSKNLNDELNKNPGKNNENSSNNLSAKSVKVVNEKAKENIYEIGGLGETQEDCNEERSSSLFETNEKSVFNVDETNVTMPKRRSNKVQPYKSKLTSVIETDPSLLKILNVSTSSQNISSTRVVSSKSVGTISSESSSTSTFFPRGGVMPLSFQDFSTDSAKALIGIFEKGEYVSDGEDKLSRTNSTELSKDAKRPDEEMKENGGKNYPGDLKLADVAEKSNLNLLKRKSTAPVETPVSKRSRNIFEFPGVASPIPDNPSGKATDDFIPSSSVKTAPLQSNLSAQKDKTSLSPVPMDLCNSPLIRRSGRASTQISTVASDNLSKISPARAAVIGTENVKMHLVKSGENIGKGTLAKSGENIGRSSVVESGGKIGRNPAVNSSEIIGKSLVGKYGENIVKETVSKYSENPVEIPQVKSSENIGKSYLKSNENIRENLVGDDVATNPSGSSKAVTEPVSESLSTAPTQPVPTFMTTAPIPPAPTFMTTASIPPAPTFTTTAPTPPVPIFMKTPTHPPPTMTLQGKVVYVEYYADNENRSKVLKQICSELGAEVVERISSNVTHVVFKDGNPGNYMKAKKFGIRIVSATWVEACKKEKKVVSEALYPSISKEKYDSPSLFAKLKKGKSMQVRDLEEDVERARIAQGKKAKLLERKKRKERHEAEMKKKNEFKVKMPTHEHYYKANGLVGKNKDVESSGLQEVLAEFQSPTGTPFKLQRITDTSFSPQSPSDVDFDTPLAKRIAAKYRSPAVQMFGTEDTPSSKAKPFVGDSPLATPNPGEKKKKIQRTRLLVDSKEANTQLLDKTQKVESQPKTVANESLRRRSGRASTQMVTAATASVCNQMEQAKTSPGLDPVSKGDPSQKDSISQAVPSREDSTSEAVLLRENSTSHAVLPRGDAPTQVEYSEAQASHDKKEGEATLDQTNYGSPILESTRTEPKSEKSTTETSRVKSASTKSSSTFFPPTKNVENKVESEALFDSLLQRTTEEKGKSQDINTESERLFDSLLQNPPAGKKVKSKGLRIRGLPSTTSEVIKKKVAKPLKSVKKPDAPVTKKSPDPSSLSINKSPRLIAPWRHLKELSNEETEPDNDDVYEFTGFGDEPVPSTEETPSVKPRKKAASKPPLPVTTSPPIGRPSSNRMFSIGLPARKKKLDESPSKSQSAINSSKEKSEVCPSIQKTSPTEILEATPNLSTVENVTTITSEGIFVTEHQNTTKKHVLLSKIFSKPPAKEIELKQINSDNEDEELRSTKKHKLFNRKSDVLDQTASPSSVRDTQDIPNVHTGETNMASNSKTVIVKNKNKDGGAFAQPPKSSSFKKPKNKKPKVTKRRARSSSSESSDPSDSDSTSSEGTSYQSSQNSKANSRVKKLNPPRRSSLEFHPLPNFARKLTEKTSGDGDRIPQSLPNSLAEGGQKVRKGRKTTPTNNIVCTSCHKDDINLVRELIKKFGKFSFSDSVNVNTSHVISGEGKRTLNLLKGLLQGCWLITKEWILASLEEDRWTDEEPYEMVDFSPAVRSVRLDRAAFEGAFKSELFKDCGVVYVSTNCRAPREELKQLIISGGGSVANLVKVSDIIVGEDRSDITTCCVTEKWILDSIQFHVIMPFADYTYLPKESE